MKPIVHSTQPRLEDVRVDLRRREIRVAQHHLDGSQVGTAVEQMSGERVTDDMRAERFREPGLTAVPFQNFPEPDAAERAAPHVHEQSRRRPFAGTSPGHERRTSIALEAADPLGGLVADRDQPLFVALADAGEVIGVEMQIGRADADQLGHTHARRVEHFDHRAISQATRCRDIGRGEQGIHLFDREKRRQRRPGTRRTKVFGGVLLEVPIERQVAIETADGGHAARHGTRRQSAGHLLPHERFERRAIQVLDAPAAPRGESGQRLQVAIVALERVRREPALHAQMVEIGLKVRGQPLTVYSRGRRRTTVRVTPGKDCQP